MLHIAVVEDDADALEQTRGFLERYARENGLELRISLFRDGSGILADYRPVYDVIFLDIEMPEVSGMEAARRIRAQDGDVVLVFVTNMARYAIQGYSVGALDYVLKPINYYTFSTKLERAVSMARRRSSGQVILNRPDGAVRLETRQIYYVEIQSRVLYYHTELGVFSVRGTLQSAEEKLAKYHFVRCNYWYLVNLMHVSEIHRDTVVVAGHELEISRRNRTAFMTALTDYVGGGA